MKMSISTTLCLLLAMTMTMTVAGSSVATTPTAYEVLQSYDFPIGILPLGATGYDLDPQTGKFNSYFKDSCSFSLQGSYQLKYKSKISGYIQNDKLASLSGVSVKILFLWVDIVEVVRKGDNLQFSVGIASAGFSIKNFYECPQCGCGLDCNSFLGNIKKITGRSDSYFSST